MQQAVNKTVTCWVAANVISGHLAQARNHRHGNAGHNQGKSRTLERSRCLAVPSAEPDLQWKLEHSF